ncbi:MAG: excinuclease ABC subunit UvrC [Christensenellales bacterium]|jgi:excinuclease ABC subunit C
MNETLKNKLAILPALPGVYLMKDAAGEIIYVGKAVSLKNRVRQYFQSSQKPLKVEIMVSLIEDFEYVICSSELEALILECNLIKRHRPRYNILLKDDKHYPYLRIDLSEDFPRAEVVRKVKQDGARYFGPYLSALHLREVLDSVYDNFPLRTCKKDINRAIARKERPCLNYQIGKCDAPCAGYISKEDYHRHVEKVIDFLSGRYDEIEKQLEQEMLAASEAMDYERAADIRDRLEKVRLVLSRQHADSSSLENRDIIAAALSGETAIVQVMMVRGGKVVGAERHELRGGEDECTVVSAFVRQYYAAAKPPAEILLPCDIEDEELVEQWLRGLRGGSVKIYCPKRGDKRRMVELAGKNAAEAIIAQGLRKQRDWQRHEGAAEALGKAIGTDYIRRLEAYDISNIQGVDSVASMVVMIDGRPSRKDYRRFRIKTVEGANDFASMAEVIQRRFSRAIEEQSKGEDGKFSDLPDLVLIDGGRIQLEFACRAMDELGFTQIPRIGLAKREEEIWLPDNDQPIVLDRKDLALQLIQRARDEAHRFAITYHRKLRGKHSVVSELDGIPGIGPRRRTMLQKAFRNMDEIKKASLEELLDAGLDRRSAASVIKHFSS